MGTMTQVSKQATRSQHARFHVTIHCDDGSSTSTYFPNTHIRVVSANNALTDEEVYLCEELLSLHNLLNNPGQAHSVAKSQANEEESSGMSEHQSIDSQDIVQLKQSEVESGSKVQLGSKEAKSKAEETEAKPRSSGAKPSMKEAEDKKLPAKKNGTSRGNLKSALPMTSPELKTFKSVTAATAATTAAAKASAATNTSSTTANMHTNPLAMGITQGAMANTTEPNGYSQTRLNFQPTTFQHQAPAPFLMLPQQQQHQLVAAARMLSSVNPGLAVAAIASARQRHNMSLSQQNQSQTMLLPQQLQLQQLQHLQQMNNGLQIQFNYQPQLPRPMSNITAPGNQFSEAIVARLAALARQRSNTENNNQAPGPRQH